MFSWKYLFKRIVLWLVFLSLLLSSSYSLYAWLCYTEDEIEYSNMRELSYSEKLKSNVFITKKEDQYFINKNDEYLLIEWWIPFSPLLWNNEADLTYVLKKANTHFEIIKNDEIIKEYFIDWKKDIYNPVTSKDWEHFSYIYVSSETVDGRKYKVNIDWVDSQEYGIITNFVFSDDWSSYWFIAYDDSGLSRILIKDWDKINAPMFQEYKWISYEWSSNDLIKILSFTDGYIVEKTNGDLIKFPNIDTMGVSYSLPLVYIDEINQLMMISSRWGNNYGLSFITNSDDCSDLKSKHVQHEKEYIISTPTIKNGVTIISENSFYWEVVDENVYSVKVNWYKLNTFNGDTWTVADKVVSEVRWFEHVPPFTHWDAQEVIDLSQWVDSIELGH